MSELLNRASAKNTIRFFYTCFKRGVIDAHALGDDLEAKEFLREKRDSWGYGILGKSGDYDWKMFRFELYWWARAARMAGLAENYIFRVRSISYAWCIFPFCMRFYLLGIEEWLNYPNGLMIERFKDQKGVHWDPNSNPYKMTRIDIISYLHTFEYEYRRLPEEQKKIPESIMVAFIQALYDMSRKIITPKNNVNL